MNETVTPKNNAVVTEAAASWNTRYVTPAGFVCQFTLRGDSGKDLLEKANAALTWLLENNYLPCENTFKPKWDGKKSENKNSNQTSTSQPVTPQNGDAVEPAANICPIHHCDMRRFEKNGRTWFSHKTDDGGWCKGK